MKEFLKKYYKNILIVFYSLVVALFWTALRINWAGISKALGADKNPSFIVMNLPILVFCFLWLVFIWSVVGSFLLKKGKKYFLPLLICNVIFTGVIIGIYFGGAYDYLKFILPSFFKSLLISVLLGVLAFVIFVMKNSKKEIYIKSIILVSSIIASVLVGYEIKINNFTYDSVVYAVEDNYQIVFSTNDSSIAWVNVGEETYYDLYSGSMKSKYNVHKISVPQEKLDKEKSYTINAQKMIYRGPFGGIKGKVISKTHEFRPVDTSDGFKYYSLSDVHDAFTPATKAAMYQEDLDLLILCGDMTSMVEYEDNANMANKIAYRITQGEYPVIYARGNHEIKGKYSEDLYKYVGSKNESFYYTFELSNKIGGVVLDLGEDHDDGWWEYYGTDKFALYHDEQTKFLEKLIEENYFNNYEYRMLVCHIPVTFVNYRKDHEDVKPLWTTLLNKCNLDIGVCGHQHELVLYEPGVVTPFEQLKYNENYKSGGKTYNGYLTDFNFVNVMSSRASLTQKQDTDDILNRYFTGVLFNVNFKENNQTVIYTNSKGENVSTCNIWSNDKLKVEHVYQLKNK